MCEKVLSPRFSKRLLGENLMTLRSITLGILCWQLCQATWATDPQIILSEDQSHAAVELWYVPPGTRPAAPELAVYADGRIWTRQTSDQERLQVPEAMVSQLVRELLLQDRLTDVDTRSLSLAIESESVRTGLTCRIPGAADTVIRIRTLAKMYEVRCHAAGLLATRFPDVKLLQNFCTAQRRLENLRAISLVGGDEAARSLARTAQAAVRTEYGVTLAVLPQHLSMVRSLPDGSRFCQFLLHSELGTGQPEMISLFQSPGQPPRVDLVRRQSSVQ